ncbi:MAG: T9SS type A sorting domain-containing protein [Aureispira sp.]
MHHVLLLLLLIMAVSPYKSTAQTLSSQRAVDWTQAGLRSDSMPIVPIYTAQQIGLINDGVTPNDSILANFISSILVPGMGIELANGTYKFEQTIDLPSNSILRGKGADSTLLLFDLGGNGNGIEIAGSRGTDSSVLLLPAVRGSRLLTFWDSTAVQAGDWIQLQQDDQDLITSSWSALQTGQIVKIDSVKGRQVWLNSPLRMDYDTTRLAAARVLHPQKNSGIECLKIKRLDDTAPQKSNNILFRYAVNCWIKGVESENCTFAHVRADFSSNIYIAQSYFHHAFSYGGNGRAYGVVFEYATGECLAENNIFEHLRHSVLLQAGANGNVIAYNYSFDPFWSSNPSNSAGDMVLHGNYVYANLFEQNICQNIVIDNSHGGNGPHNTFFRNRAQLFGIFFSDATSPNQNFIANEVTNTGFPYSLVNYRILGTGHFLHGNNNKGTLTPAGTGAVPELSYAYTQRPNFVPPSQWGQMGTPALPSAHTIPAYDRWQNGTPFQGTCTNNPFTAIVTNKKKNPWMIYPNPARQQLWVEGEELMRRLVVYNALGQLIYQTNVNEHSTNIPVNNWQEGWYLLTIETEAGELSQQKIIVQR